jgi:hypothetical protein
MSAILQGADKAYLREYEESADKKRLYALKSALDSVQQETKNAGYIQNGLVLDIQLAVRRIYEDLGIDVSDGSTYDEAEDAVRKATSDLESAIYSLDEQIKLEIKEVNSSISNTELGELEESPTYVDGFMGADGKLTSKPTAADYASNKEFQHMKKTLGDRIPQPTKRDKDGKLSPFTKKDDNVQEEKQRLDPKCWDGYKKQGTKMKGDKRVNNCVPVKESNILKGLNESQLDEGAKEKLIALGLAGALGLGALMPSAEDSPLGKELQAAAQAGDAVAAYHLNNLDLYTDEGMARTLVNLKIAYIDDSPREDVKAFLSDPKRFPALARK